MKTRLLGVLILILLYAAACSMQPETVLNSSRIGRNPVTAAHFGLGYTNTEGSGSIWIPITGKASKLIQLRNCTYQPNFGHAFHLLCTE